MPRKRLKSASDQRPFTMVYDDFLESTVLDHYEKLVFICLKKFTNNDTMKAFPSVSKLSKMTGICKRKVFDVLKSLEDKKVISIEHRDDKDKGHISNLYTLYDYREIWQIEDIKDIEKVSEEVSVIKMIKELENKGYYVTKEKVVSADQSKDTTPKTYADNNKNNNESQYERYTIEQIKELFCYDAMVNDRPELIKDIETVINILYANMNTSKDTIRIGGDNKPSMVVIGKLMKLTHSGILYAIDKYNEQTERINNPMNYMLTLLYNAEDQMQLDINNQVKHDLYGNK